MILNKTYIIAEIGVNHNGSMELAKAMIDSAVAAGANAVKFQTFFADKLANRNTPKVEYQLNTTAHSESHYEMLKKLELTFNQHENLFEYCDNANIDYISTPYDIESAKFLVDLGVKYIKTASADLVDMQLHQFLATTEIPILIATGMSTLDEVRRTVSLYEDSNIKDQITLLHCVSSYPCTSEAINLRVLNTLKDEFDCSIGYSDHSIGSIAATLSVAAGASVIEKHFTLDKGMDGPDHKASSTPDEFADLVRSIRMAEAIMGHGSKKVQPEEYDMRKISRKSIVASRNLDIGQVVTKDDFILQRPGNGLSPFLLNSLVGKTLKRSISVYEQITMEDLM